MDHQQPGIGTDDLPRIYREAYVHAIESARAQHDPTQDWQSFRDYLWAALVRGFGLDIDAPWPSYDDDPPTSPPPSATATYDQQAIADMTLALMHLTTFQDSYGWRTWKGHDWDTLDRLHQTGMISDPKSKARSVPLTDQGHRRSRELFEHHFTTREPDANQAD